MRSVRSRAPLYRRIAEVLAREVENGRWASAGLLPSEAELVRRFGVSRITVRHALAVLQAQGLIFREQGRGTYASPPKLVRHLHPLVTFEEDMAQQNVDLVTKIDEFVEVVPPDWARSRFHGLRVRRAVRLLLRRIVGGLCVCHDERYLVPSAAEVLRPANLAERSTREILRQTTGVRLTHLANETEVVPAGEIIAGAMGLVPGALVLQNTYTSYADGGPVEVGRASYRADRFRFSFGERQWKS